VITVKNSSMVCEEPFQRNGLLQTNAVSSNSVSTKHASQNCIFSQKWPPSKLLNFKVNILQCPKYF
jgi:hypothetical protein